MSRSYLYDGSKSPIILTKILKEFSFHEHFKEKETMDTSTSIEVARGNDFFIKENVKMPPGIEFLSRNTISQTASELTIQQNPEKRFEQKILVKFYDSLEDDFFSFDGTIQLKKEDGLSFIASWPLEVETPVLIRRKIHLNSCLKDSLDEGKHAQVISCKKVQSKSDEPQYLISAKYF